MNEARVGAEREAFLLYDTLPRPRAKVGWRVKSLRGPLAKPRIARFLASVDEGQVTMAQRRRSFSLKALPLAVGRSMRGAKYAVLADLPEIKVVQVHCPGWLTKGAARMKYEHSEIPPDPFC